MELIYKIAIWVLLFLGVGHCGYTFKKYKMMQPEALWFFSASMGLIFNGLLNYINLAVPDNEIIEILTLGANIFQILFYLVAAYKIRVVTIFSGAIVTLMLLISSIYYYEN